MTAYPFKTKPYRHQVRAIKLAMRQFKAGRGVGFLFEPRTGKTKTTIDTLCVLNMKYGVRKAVVFAPNRVLDTWVEQFHEHAPIMVQTIVWDADARKAPLPTTMGPYAMQVVIVNYEAFATPGKRTRSGNRSRANGRFKHRSLLAKWIGAGPCAGVVDEGHKLKNPSGKASTMIVGMRDYFAYRFLLTGTPVTKAKRAHDIYMQWQWVNPARFEEWGSTVELFKNHTGRWLSSNGFPQWVGPRPQGIEDMRQGIHRDALVVKRDECLDLPARLPDRIIHVPLGPSAKHYDEMAEEMVTELRNGAVAEASIPLVVTLRLLQICSGFVGIQERRHIRGRDRLVSVPHRIGFEKLDALRDILLEEVIERDEKVVIAARFVPDLNAIAALCDELGVSHWSIRGGKGAQFDRRASSAAIAAYRRHDEAGVMIVQPAAASLGIDLSTAAHMVWYSLTPSWVDWTQACDRIALSPRGAQYTYLLADAPADLLAYEALQLDTNMSRHIMTKPDVLLRKGSRSRD